jgi:hypothetical protein
MRGFRLRVERLISGWGGHNRKIDFGGMAGGVVAVGRDGPQRGIRQQSADELGM